MKEELKGPQDPDVGCFEKAGADRKRMDDGAVAATEIGAAVPAAEDEAEAEIKQQDLPVCLQAFLLERREKVGAVRPPQAFG